jgi:hypothetical protein
MITKKYVPSASSMAIGLFSGHIVSVAWGFKTIEFLQCGNAKKYKLFVL